MAPSRKRSNAGLWELIHSLSRTEKRYFRRFTTIRGNSEELLYLSLFDLLNAQDAYRSEEIKAEMDDPKFTKRYSAHKNYLHRLILRSMRAYNAERFAENRIQGWISDGIFLYHKTLYAQSQKAFDKAWELASSLEYLTFLLEILKWKRRLIKRVRARDQFGQLTQLAETGNLLLQRLGNEMQYHELYEQVYAVSQANPRHGAAAVPGLENIGEDPLLTDAGQAYTFQARHLFYQINLYKAHLDSESERAFAWQREQYLLWQAHPTQQKEQPFRYSTVLTNFLGMAAVLGDDETFLEVRSLLDKVNIQSDHEAFQIRQQVYFLDLLRSLNQQEFGAGLALIPKLSRWLSRNGSRLHRSREMAFRFNIAAIGLLAGDHGTAFRWFRKIADQERAPDRVDIKAASLLFLAILHHISGEPELVESRMRALRRYGKLYFPNGYQNWLVPHLEKVLFMAPGADQATAMEDLNDRLVHHPDSSGWQHQAGLSEFLIWLRRVAQRD